MEVILVIVGPTGVGKTKLSIELAKKYKGIIINADATQIYKELDIGSAKIKKEEMEGIKHYLIDFVEPTQDYTVSDYQSDIRKILDSHKNDFVIIVGGTGLYINAALFDYEFSNRLEIDLSNYSNMELLSMCQEIDKDVNIHVNNRIRLENYLKKEKKECREPKLLYECLFVGLTTPRDHLYTIINERVDKMFDEGLVEEVRYLKNKYSDANILKRAIGYKEVIGYLNGEYSLEASIELVKKNSRHYAKRQYTWFNNKLDVKWFNVQYENFSNTINDVSEYIDSMNK